MWGVSVAFFSPQLKEKNKYTKDTKLNSLQWRKEEFFEARERSDQAAQQVLFFPPLALPCVSGPVPQVISITSKWHSLFFPATLLVVLEPLVPR